MSPRPRRVTQREIAELAGVSQTTVSVVLNDRDGSNVRVPEATRARVKAAIEQLTYVADPAARRLAGLDNQIIGVFTYEAALSPESMDFYGPLLNGIERAAEHIGWDLLFFTSSPVENGTRSLFHRKTRLRLTDGCVLLGQQMVASELERLVAEQFPFVAIGRRDETAAAVPYVAIDYVTPTTALIDQAAADGHQQALYVHRGRDTPTARDRRGAVEAASAEGRLAFLLVGEERIADLPRLTRATGATLIIAEDAFLAEDVAHALSGAGVAVPDETSLAALGEVRGHRVEGRGLAGFHIPRQQLAAEALDLLQLLITTDPQEWAGLDTERLLVAEVEPGDTIVARTDASS
ncbi:LacI family DNA-binding transcriptional regulator [Streptomyces umbrinus]|uniref:LacI family DNA-binding transcriptional regulator n=1 Tax=Streptomyces TaxID=1883 RepID=UPI00167E691A|nr:LacI family DNA-binding transcriptional regulator [Streptomyces umbrinus]MCR3729613.1 DNA-binding LacI/PurR family transcriptional regulator [Streptomyces umbrinus]MCX4555177.1 LacI family transcriptional regulator [Streptomyces phaeochromogenes]GHH59862.1 LacI family transcriptional regulator [Streptomyces umbrinus]